MYKLSDFYDFLNNSNFSDYEKMLVKSDLDKIAALRKLELPVPQFSPSEKSLLKKIKPLLTQGKYKDCDDKDYNYRIKTSAKEFVTTLKKIGIKDIDSKQWIYKNILMPKELNNAIHEQVTWTYFRREFTRKS